MEEAAAKRVKREEKERADKEAGKGVVNPASRQYNHAPEVKMASSLRDQVEAAITKAGTRKYRSCPSSWSLTLSLFRRSKSTPAWEESTAKKGRTRGRA